MARRNRSNNNTKLKEVFEITNGVDFKWVCLNSFRSILLTKKVVWYPLKVILFLNINLNMKHRGIGITHFSKSLILQQTYQYKTKKRK